MERLTKERALELHRQMWTDMQAELGDCPGDRERIAFKKKWCKEHGFNDVCSDCFLCEYVVQKSNYYDCSSCPIDWKKGEGIVDCWQDGDDSFACCAPGYKNWIHDYFLFAPISLILAIPEREVTNE